jgi:hypothetical protein
MLDDASQGRVWIVACLNAATGTIQIVNNFSNDQLGDAELSICRAFFNV